MAGLAARESRAGLLSRDRVLKTAVVLSSVLFVLSAATAIGQLAWSDRINRRGGCGFDGYYYCLMLKGEVAPKPFSRRILLPFLARQVSTNSLAGFWLVNVLSLVAVTLVVMYLASRLRPVVSAHAHVAFRVVPPLLVGAAALLARNTFHIAATLAIQVTKRLSRVSSRTVPSRNTNGPNASINITPNRNRPAQLPKSASNQTRRVL